MWKVDADLKLINQVMQECERLYQDARKEGKKVSYHTYAHKHQQGIANAAWRIRDFAKKLAQGIDPNKQITDSISSDPTAES